jgi:hypothetical protein
MMLIIELKSFVYTFVGVGSAKEEIEEEEGRKE